ncbi:MAG: CTP synthase [Povalibacter sp.]
MSSAVKVGLVGDFDANVTAHRAIPEALRLVGEATRLKLEHEWIATDRIQSEAHVTDFDGLWCVPGSPYRNTAGALLAIAYARSRRVPFLGTCGGFQHAILEYARNVLGWSDADHAETAPDARRLIIAPLACSLVEETDAVQLVPRSRIARAYSALTAQEGYHCRYGLNPEFESALLSGALHATARDTNEEVRAIELVDHPFFVATLFQPERAALKGDVPPLVAAFIKACVE